MSELAMGRALAEPIPQIITVWLLMKEFPGLNPEIIDRLPDETVKKLSKMSYVFNIMQNNIANSKKQR